ncbi:MAG TPA: GlsB/YeaQ/YmgE family stress response membrane protein [Polyangia bacterium]|jgi:uncharacterized membrane protein YeaQ/YmgE (transglycosylase-associated protein family)|nr:GlsB/YeaQ/YmgE family stress response membrane protein [Polyangia bacterium]
MHYLWTAIVGLVVGALAKLLMPGRDPGGFIITIVLGIAGSFLASYIGKAAGLYRAGQSAGFIASIIGAMALLLAYRLVNRLRAAG